MSKETKGLAISLIVLAVSVAAGPVAGEAPPESEEACLYAFSVGGRRLQGSPCVDGDTLSVTKNADVASVMRALGIRSDSVRFVGCKDGQFSVAEEQLPGSDNTRRRYVIAYPSSPDVKYLAPIIHELAHVLQLNSAGGLAQLRAELDSKRIELAADFLTGVVFTAVLGHVDAAEFQHGLALTGLYREPNLYAHGDPTERTAAFRRGRFFRFESVARSYQRAGQEFQENIYGQIIPAR